jgi:hypothetical protein
MAAIAAFWNSFPTPAGMTGSSTGPFRKISERYDDFIHGFMQLFSMPADATSGCLRSEGFA